MARLLKQKINSLLATDQSHSSVTSVDSDAATPRAGKMVCAKLPKLQVKRFNGNVVSGKSFGTSLRALFTATLVCLTLTNLITYED